MDLLQRLVEGEGELILTGGEQTLGLEQAGEGVDGQAEGAQQAEALGELVQAGAELDDAADVETEQGDLVVEAGELAGLEGGQVGFAEVGGVEAVGDGVAVAGLTAAAALGGRGGKLGVHALFVAQIF